MKPDETTPNKIGQFLREPVVAPADEEVARENLDRCICAEPQPCEESVPMHYRDLLRLVLGRTLAEARRAGTCTWTCEPNPDIEMWETDCGNAFQFEADGPTENKMKFCCYCGKQLAEKVAEGEGDG